MEHDEIRDRLIDIGERVARIETRVEVFHSAYEKMEKQVDALQSWTDREIGRHGIVAAIATALSLTAVELWRVLIHR